jgi:hypothetical protein
MLRICAPSDVEYEALPLLESPSPSFQDLIDVLLGVKAAPSSRFLSVKDTNLDEGCLAALAEALKNSPFTGGLRLRGASTCFNLLYTLTLIDGELTLCHPVQVATWVMLVPRPSQQLCGQTSSLTA